MFLNPFFLVGALAAGVPLAIHLMHRRTSRVVRWPSLRFLVASNRRTARRRRVQEVLLLLLRMGLLAFLSVALARPVLRAWGLPGAGAETAVVVVLDNSMSMSAREAGSPSGDRAESNLARPEDRRASFALAKQAAEEVLRVTPQGASVAFRLADGTEPPLARALSRDRGAVRRALRASSASEARGDVGARVAEAIGEAASSGAPAAEVYCLTDLQAAAFARAPLSKGRSGRPVALVFFDCGRAPVQNVAVSKVAARATRPVAGSPVAVDVRLRSFATAAQDRRVVLEIEGEGARAERFVKALPPGAAEAVAFRVTPGRAGELAGRVYLAPPDDLAPDDSRFFRIRLAERIPVLVVEREPSAIRTARASFFLAAALDPTGEDAGAPAGLRSPLAPRVEGPAYLSGKDAAALLRSFPVAVLADLGELSAEEARLWVEYVGRGGSLLAFPSETGGLELAAAALAEAAGGPFLPAEPGAPRGDADLRAEPRRIDVDGIDFRPDEALRPFRELDSTLRAVTVWRAYDLRVTHASGGRATLPLEGGGTFLAARRFGRGEVRLFAVPAGTRWSDFPARSLFLPLLHAIAYEAAGRDDRGRSFLVGQRAAVSVPPGPAEKARPVRLTEPGGRVTEIAPRPAEGGGADVVVERLARAGVHRIEGGAFEEPAALVANVDPDESDPARVGPARLRELYADAAGMEPVVVGDVGGLRKAVARLRKGFELWDYLLLLVLSVALFECFYANRRAPCPPRRVSVPVQLAGPESSRPESAG
jgi:hypothetical protein